MYNVSYYRWLFCPPTLQNYISFLYYANILLKNHYFFLFSNKIVTL